MEQNSPVETFQSVREDNLFKQTVYSGKVPVGQSQYACSIYILSIVWASSPGLGYILIYVGQSYRSVGHQYTRVGQTINLSFT
jgi:hypothetical protein